MSRFTDKLLLEENYIDYVSLVYVTEDDTSTDKESNTPKQGFFKTLWKKFLKFIDWLCKKAKQFKDWLTKIFKKIFKRNKDKQKEEQKQRKSDGDDNKTESSTHVLKITEDKLDDINDELNDLYDASEKYIEKLKRVIDSQDGEIDFDEETIKDELKINSFEKEMQEILNTGKDEYFTLPDETDRFNEMAEKVYEKINKISDNYYNFMGKVQKECDKIDRLLNSNIDDLDFSENSISNLNKTIQFTTKSLSDVYGSLLRLGQECAKQTNITNSQI